MQFTQAHQNWTKEDWKNVAWSDESRFLLRHSDGRVRIWCKQHESMAPSCLVSAVQAAAGGGGVIHNPTEHLWDVVEREVSHQGCAADKSAATV